MSAGMTTGVFARRSRLSHKALRLYEQLGLLVPARVDPSQGYRRYAEEQLRVARTIALLRRLDMPLARVNEDGDGPVELCLPIHSGQEREHAVRVEPAHREVYVRVTKAQYEFPQILSVYDAIEQSLAEQGLRMLSPPREILIAGVDPNAAAHGKEVCDVAFPAE